MKKVINGKNYQAWNGGRGYPKKMAQDLARGLRTQGYSVRVTQEKHGSVIWYRRKGR
jgi:phage replication-related protein YjqB (UPF0714/DUF867 family)